MRSRKLEWEEAKDVKKDIKEIVKVLNLNYVKPSRIFCYRSYGSSSRAYARIWAIPKIFQRALNIEPAYVVEVLAKYYDKKDDDTKKSILIHELLHIPKNFSGALLSHRGRSRHLGRDANILFKEYKRLRNQ
ncbi:MAG: metallopeptidase [Candidatus Levybacteria bacterium]|nr:metallopeptidase [Candidatus Levybacteria bacterium]